MTLERKREAAAVLSGLLFGAGLVVAGMTLPTKVIGFLDVFDGSWDPTLGLVMGGAIAVHSVVYRWVKGRRTPLLADGWSLPTRRDIDGRLLLGAALFGVGWGLGGFCPGPALVSLAGGALSSVVFVASMVLAMAATARLEAHLAARDVRTASSREAKSSESA